MPLFTFRPLPNWPYPTTRNRPYCRFKAGYDATLDLLQREIEMIDGKNMVVGIGLRESDIRLDGLPRANARSPLHPGVEISFDSRFGRLTYSTDEYDEWQDNLRAIALSLQALRAIDRYGVSKRGQQYAGWAQLSSGGPDPVRGKVLVDRAGGLREAMLKHHPDHGGRDQDIIDVIAYRDSLGQ